MENHWVFVDKTTGNIGVSYIFVNPITKEYMEIGPNGYYKINHDDVFK